MFPQVTFGPKIKKSKSSLIDEEFGVKVKPRVPPVLIINLNQISSSLCEDSLHELKVLERAKEYFTNFTAF
jgi:hypothetical protein